MTRERIQKIIARSGKCSRRAAEELIRQARVKVNGRRAVLGEKADPEHDAIKVDGKLLARAQHHQYVLLYKPRGVVTTCDDPEERVTVIDLVRGVVRGRVFPVGRLDYHSEGLLLLTNDGELAARIAHPRYGVVREYQVKIKGTLSDKERAKVVKGTTIMGHRVTPLSVQHISTTRVAANSWWKVTIAEGKTHEVRELFARAGHPVQRLRRSAIGPIRDDQLRPGQARQLTERELALLSEDVAKGA